MWPSVTPDYQLFDMTTDLWEQDDVSDDHPESSTGSRRRCFGGSKPTVASTRTLLRTAREGLAGVGSHGFEGV